MDSRERRERGKGHHFKPMPEHEHEIPPDAATAADHRNPRRRNNGANGEAPWDAIRASAVYHPHLMFNDTAALIAVSELAPELGALQETVEALLDQGGVRRAYRT